MSISQFLEILCEVLGIMLVHPVTVVLTLFGTGKLRGYSSNKAIGIINSAEHFPNFILNT